MKENGDIQYRRMWKNMHAHMAFTYLSGYSGFWTAFLKMQICGFHQVLKCTSFIDYF